MARKTTGVSSSRNKKTPAQPAIVEAAPEVAKLEVTKKQKNIAKTVQVSGNPASGNRVSRNLEEQIRVRAYELYLQRRATAGDGDGNQHQDWLLAEREILSRDNGQSQRTA